MVELCLLRGKIIGFREPQSTIMLRNAIITYRDITGLPKVEKYTTIKQGCSQHRNRRCRHNSDYKLQHGTRHSIDVRVIVCERERESSVPFNNAVSCEDSTESVGTE